MRNALGAVLGLVLMLASPLGFGGLRHDDCHDDHESWPSCPVCLFHATQTTDPVVAPELPDPPAADCSFTVPPTLPLHAAARPTPRGRGPPRID
ncbi:MAG: hypothetical protein KC591_16630 [Gemmatimonadetes bacterium]|nr:hypothetical protein [Gemmatimonadota bacterium]